MARMLAIELRLETKHVAFMRLVVGGRPANFRFRSWSA
jgi:hypothetical protein